LQQAASVMAEGETRLPLFNKNDDALGGIAMAKGTVVSFFKGGLTAVKIDDDQMMDEKVERVNALNPKKVPIDDKFKSDSGMLIVLYCFLNSPMLFYTLFPS